MKSTSNKAVKKEQSQHDANIVKTENELGMDSEEEEEEEEGHGLNIHVKEEPLSQDICEEPALSCVDSKPDPLTCCSDARVKQERDSDLQPLDEYDSGSGIKEEEEEESESWIKEERNSEVEAAEEPDTIQEDYEEGEEDCAESSSEFFPCPHCTVSFTDLEFLEKHVKWVHQKQYLDNLKNCLSSRTLSLIPKHKCTICSSSFNSKVKLKAHVGDVFASANQASS
ncbi:gastrula zinc finger protein XlCGF57.1-like [Solea senegalensis]|uniref:Gastrula zinc finger protein XlCGF57.1-like n=1 Tax=Solea senegalensis TaxID=28829 RepID=A0AAV6PQA3_SOLSE|nr:gastrula zinc finger protein XlCGF57.1-like [Solea senegalensis]